MSMCRVDSSEAVQSVLFSPPMVVGICRSRVRSYDGCFAREWRGRAGGSEGGGGAVVPFVTRFETERVL